MTNPEVLRLSFSGASTWLSCRQKWYFAYKEQLQGKGTSYPLQIGSVLHDLVHKHYVGELSLEHIQNLDQWVSCQYPNQTKEVSMEIALEAGRLLAGYLRKYEEDPLEVISSELKIEVSRVEPITGKEYILYGIIDAVCRTQDKRLWRLEHKTASAIDTYYLKGLRSGLQGGIYHYLLNKTMPEPVIGTIYNMFVKTKIPKYERMPVMMQSLLAERSLKTCDGVARQIFSGDIFPDAGSCFTYNRDCDYLPLCNVWKGQWDAYSERIRDSFFQVRETRETKEQKGKELKD